MIFEAYPVCLFLELFPLSNITLDELAFEIPEFGRKEFLLDGPGLGISFPNGNRMIMYNPDLGEKRRNMDHLVMTVTPAIRVSGRNFFALEKKERRRRRTRFHFECPLHSSPSPTN
jgi:hypothetical protein